MHQVHRNVTLLPDVFVVGDDDRSDQPGRLQGEPRRGPPPPPPPPPGEEPEFQETNWAGWTAEPEPERDDDNDPSPIETPRFGVRPTHAPAFAGAPASAGIDLGPAGWSGGSDQVDLAAQLEEADRILEQARAEAAELIERATREAEQQLALAQSDLERAHAEAERVRLEAQDDVEQIRVATIAAAHEEGHREGFEAGRLEGAARADEEIAERVAHVTSLAESAAVDRRELLRNAEGEVVRLAMRIARKILNRELTIEPAVVTSIAEAALQHVTVDGRVKLRVHPDDHAALQSYWTRAHGETEGARSFEVVADADVSRGGVVIDTRAGTIDAQIETQLDEIAKSLQGEQPAAPQPEAGLQS